jgi:hypothetical protein
LIKNIIFISNLTYRDKLVDDSLAVKKCPGGMSRTAPFPILASVPVVLSKHVLKISEDFEIIKSEDILTKCVFIGNNNLIFSVRHQLN